MAPGFSKILPDSNDPLPTDWDEALRTNPNPQPSSRPNPPALDRRDPLGVMGRTVGGRYTLQGYLGGGGFAHVYAANDQRFEELDGAKARVAIKLMWAAGSVVANFRREAHLMKQFKHTNVVDVYDYAVEEDGLAWLAMEYLPGLTLLDYLEQQKGRLPEEKFCKFVQHTSQALQHAHDHNLVHRDLKPANIMLVDEGKPSEHFKILDFGLATKTDASSELINKTMASAGTYLYMSPEQVDSQGSGAPITPKSDIYTFGIILYELLNGTVPFPATGGFAKCILDIVQNPPPKFSRATVNYPPDSGVDMPKLEALVQSCLAKKPQDRPATMLEVRDRFLEAFEPLRPAVLPTRPTSLVSSLMLLIALEMCVGAWYLFQAPAASGPGEWHIVQPVPITVAAGTSQEFLVAINRKDFLTPIELAFPLLPVGIAAKPLKQGADLDTITVRLEIDPAMDAQAYDLTVQGRPNTLNPSANTQTVTLRLNVEAPFSIRTEGVSLEAGATERFDIQLIRSVPDLPIRLVCRGEPAGSEIRCPDGPISASAVRIAVVTGPNTAPGIYQITCQAEALLDNRLVKQTIVFPLQIVAPDTWLPKSQSIVGGPKFEKSTEVGTQVVLVDGKKLYSRIDLLLPAKNEDQPTRVPFVLVHDQSQVKPFYIMENKVWNKLFEKLAVKHRSLSAKDEWREIAAKYAKQIGHTADGLPVFNVNYFEAREFAQRLAGGDLPTAKQWDAAAGYDEKVQKTGGPFKPSENGLKPDVAVKLQYPREVGTSHDDVSDAGCRDMAGNGVEWTRDRFEGGPAVDSRKDADIQLRGRDFKEDQPLLFENFGNDQFGISESKARALFRGFRVVIEVPNE